MNKVECFADLEVYKCTIDLQQAIFLARLQFDEFRAKLTGIGRQLGSMINRHASFCYRTTVPPKH